MFFSSTKGKQTSALQTNGKGELACEGSKKELVAVITQLGGWGWDEDRHQRSVSSEYLAAHEHTHQPFDPIQETP